MSLSSHCITCWLQIHPLGTDGAQEFWYRHDRSHNHFSTTASLFLFRSLTFLQGFFIESMGSRLMLKALGIPQVRWAHAFEGTHSVRSLSGCDEVFINPCIDYCNLSWVFLAVGCLCLLLFLQCMHLGYNPSPYNANASHRWKNCDQHHAL